MVRCCLVDEYAGCQSTGCKIENPFMIEMEPVM
jgi:hypothetical protein